MLNFFPVQKLIFSHFWNCKKWNLVEKIIRGIDLFDFTSFLAWILLNFLAHCARVGDNKLLAAWCTVSAHSKTYINSTFFSGGRVWINFLKGSDSAYISGAKRSNVFFFIQSWVPKEIILAMSPFYIRRVTPPHPPVLGSPSRPLIFIVWIAEMLIFWNLILRSNSITH